MGNKKKTNNKKSTAAKPESAKAAYIQQIKALMSTVLDLLNHYAGTEFSLKKIFKALGAENQREKNAIQAVLAELVASGKIQEPRPFTFVSQKKLSGKTYQGRVDHVSRDYAYVICDEFAEDVMISTERLHHAFHGDTVEFVLISKGRNRKIQGEVTNIISRNKTEFVGKLEISLRYAFVVVDDRKIHSDFFLPLAKVKEAGAKHGDKVIIELGEWRPNDKNPTAMIKRVLGKSGENDTEMHAILFEFGLPAEFEKHLEEEAEKIPLGITPEETAKRRDFRNITTFTIDPDTAKDFDDAISIRQLDNGNWEIGVHIADVTHYVTEGSPIDLEGERRATSVYLVDRVVPMLPEKLSNYLCSLVPNEDRLTFSTVFEMTESGKIENTWIGKTVIHSDRRFTYEEAQDRIETGLGEFADEIRVLNTIAKKLQAKRFRAGAISFESVEVKFSLDEKGKPVGIIPKIRKDAHKLIEEFMLLANKTVAEFAFRYNRGGAKRINTMIYRVHELPDPEKLENLALIAKKFGHELDLNEKKFSHSLNHLSATTEGKPEHYILQSLSVRAMAKARYTTEPLGHFGLAFKHYSHFTSPIRRYPDVMVHRLLFDYLNGKNSPARDAYEAKSKHSSDMEKRAADAERASIKLKQVEYMSEHIGKRFDGIVSGVTEWGLYIEIPATACEGMVRVSDMEDDYYDYDSRNHALRGRKRNNLIALGDKVVAQVKSVDFDKRSIDLIFIRKIIG
jgi:ribonuclease R